MSRFFLPIIMMCKADEASGNEEHDFLWISFWCSTELGWFHSAWDLMNAKTIFQHGRSVLGVNLHPSFLSCKPLNLNARQFFTNLIYGLIGLFTANFVYLSRFITTLVESFNGFFTTVLSSLVGFFTNLFSSFNFQRPKLCFNILDFED